MHYGESGPDGAAPPRAAAPFLRGLCPTRKPGRHPATADTQLQADELLALLQSLPTGYRTVFNLYAIEGYSHPEIAEALGITEGTSKSQLSKARALLQRRLHVVMAS
ncbi:RNA polymerase sigma factor [Hymenobacter sp. BRD128]|uniref:RNA polymerase sigma factor n=1 Tax=Hymenobacter sp. BRD128 TaxID=2675878 RepID=UPI00349FA8D2